MDLTIIIVNWNTRDLLGNCLRSIAASSGSLAVQTIVVDNHSADGTREMVSSEFPEVLLIDSGANLGFARANNLGLPQAVAQLVLFLNPDTEIRRGTLQAMVGFMRQRLDVGAMGCKIRNSDGTLQELGLQWFPSPLTELLRLLVVSELTYRRLPAMFPYHDPEVSGPVCKLFGACLLVRKCVLDQVGSFDERFFMYCEDVDFCYRVIGAGWRLYYLAETEILHLGGASSAGATSSFSVLMMCESFSKFMRKHHGTWGSAAYRTVAFTGAQARLLILYALSLARSLRLRSSPSDLSGPIRKYAAITRWALGLQQPVIRQ